MLTLLVGIVGILAMNGLNTDYTNAVEIHGKPLETIGLAVADLHTVRAELRGAMLLVGDDGRVREQEALVREYLADFEARTKDLEPLFPRADAKALYLEAMATYADAFLPAVERILADIRAGVGQDELLAYMVAAVKPAADLVAGNMTACMTIKSGMLETTSAEGAALAGRMFLVLPLLIAATVAVSAALSLYIAGLIGKPLVPLTRFLSKASTVGDIALSQEDHQIIARYSQGRDEIARIIVAIHAFVSRIHEVSEGLSTIAAGDLTVEVRPLSDQDTLGLSLQNMTGNLNDMFGSIQASTEQVSDGARQVADGAQNLAQGATEQAASVEELSSAIAGIAAKTRANEETSGRAAMLADAIRGSAEKGSRQMEEMLGAVKEINEASNSIGKVIKTIDDIAFQTNILALNASVEAARAGQHGRGFAVVAEEVRTLATKSAEAARETGGLIANSIEKAELGLRMAGETSASFAEIVAGIEETGALVQDTAQSAKEQSTAIEQIDIGIDQVAQVVQQNSATAQESAAASQEMSGQSTMLRELIAQFKLKEGSAAPRGLSLGKTGGDCGKY